MGECFVHVQTHMGEFQADVGVELSDGDLVKQLMIKLGAGAGFFGLGNVFAEIVNRDAHARLVDGSGSAESVFHFGSGHKAAG